MYRRWDDRQGQRGGAWEGPGMRNRESGTWNRWRPATAPATCFPCLNLVDSGNEVGGKPSRGRRWGSRSEEHTSELQSLMRNSYAVFCLKQKRQHKPKLN